MAVYATITDLVNAATGGWTELAQRAGQHVLGLDLVVDAGGAGGAAREAALRERHRQAAIRAIVGRAKDAAGCALRPPPPARG